MRWERVAFGVLHCRRQNCFMDNEARWAGEQEDGAASLLPSTNTMSQVPASFTREYNVLAEVCANISSGFVLLNHHERVTYANASAQRLLRIERLDPHDVQTFDVG